MCKKQTFGAVEPWEGIDLIDWKLVASSECEHREGW